MLEMSGNAALTLAFQSRRQKRHEYSARLKKLPLSRIGTSFWAKRITWPAAVAVLRVGRVLLRFDHPATPKTEAKDVRGSMALTLFHQRASHWLSSTSSCCLLSSMYRG